MGTSDFEVGWCIKGGDSEEHGTLIIEVPDFVYDEDADRDRDMDDDLSPLVLYLAEEVREIVDEHAEVQSYGPVE